MERELLDESHLEGRRWALQTRGAMMRSIGTGGALQVSILASGILAARLLGPDDRGNLAIFLIIALIVVQLGTVGLPVALTYYAARQPENADPLVRRLLPTAAAQAGAIFILQAGILAVVFRDAPEMTRRAALISLFTGPALVVHVYGLALLQAVRAYGRYNLQRLMYPVLYSVGLVVLLLIVHDGQGLVLVTATYSGAVLITSAFTFASARRAISTCTRVDDGAIPTRGKMTRFGLRSLLGSYGAVEHLQLDQALVSVLLPARDLGLYVVAVAFTQLPRFLGTSIGVVAYPEIAHTAPHQQVRRMWGITLGALAIGAVVAGAEMVVVGTVLPFAFGDEFASAAGAARILLIGAVFQMTRRVLSEASRGAGAPLPGTVSEVSLYVLIGVGVLLSDRSLEGISWALTAGSAGSLGVLLVAVRMITLRARAADA